MFYSAKRRHLCYVLMGCTGLLAACASNAPAPDISTQNTPTLEEQQQAAQMLALEQRRQQLFKALSDQDPLISAHDQDGDDSLLVRLAAAKGFDKNSAKPTPAMLKLLDKVIAALANTPDATLRIVGHTDSLGSEQYNLQLSIKRAETVMDYMRKKGIALMNLSAEGQGEDSPIADNKTPEGRAKNRRIDIYVTPR